MGVLRETRAYRRLQVDERRRQLLERATDLFATHGYDELSMAKIARAAGVSKPLLYHYFPTKRQLFEAVLSQAAEQHLQRVDTDSDLPPAEQLSGSLDAYLAWIEENRETYANLMRSAGVPEVRELIDRVREATAQRILAGLSADGEPSAKVRTAVRGWLWLMDGVCLDWARERDLDRAEVHGLLIGSLFGALTAAGYDPAPLAAAREQPL
jgi:AcrR family transcriptional regulator